MLRRIKRLRWRLLSNDEIIELWEAVGESEPYNKAVGYELYDSLTAELRRRGIHGERMLIARGEKS